MPCFHRWSSTGRCVAPGCRAERAEGQDGGLPHPSTLSSDRAQRIRELLAQGWSARAISKELGTARATVARVKDGL